MLGEAKSPDPLPPTLSFLLQPQRQWSSKHIEFLKVALRCDVPTSEIVGSEYIPGDDDVGEFFVVRESIRISSPGYK